MKMQPGLKVINLVIRLIISPVINTVISPVIRTDNYITGGGMLVVNREKKNKVK